VLGYIAALWGITGICLLLGSAIYRLSAIGLQTFSYQLDWYHWLALAVSIAFMLKGIVAFSKHGRHV
jgi:hypothetical protein